MSTLDLHRLLRSLPHADPFRFVDELLELEPRVRGRGLWRVRGDEDFFRGHFPPPGQPIVPGVLIGEGLAQVAGLVAFSGLSQAGTPTPARLAQIDVKIHAAVRPPALIELNATFVRDMGPLVLLDVEARSNEAPVAGGRVVLARSE